MQSCATWRTPGEPGEPATYIWLSPLTLYHIGLFQVRRRLGDGYQRPGRSVWTAFPHRGTSCSQSGNYNLLTYIRREAEAIVTVTPALTNDVSNYLDSSFPAATGDASISFFEATQWYYRKGERSSKKMAKCPFGRSPRYRAKVHGVPVQDIRVELEGTNPLFNLIGWVSSPGSWNHSRA